MAGLASLPQDIFSLLLLYLSLSEVIRLRQASSKFEFFHIFYWCCWKTSRFINEVISSDKRFWIQLLETISSDHGYRLPTLTQSLDLLEASDLESWSRTALTLIRSYTSAEPEVTVLSLSRSLQTVTWVKLVRGRWCLAAVSDFSSSRLILYDGRIGFASEPQAELYLPGPVMDAVMEDRVSEINIALSIGTTSVSIRSTVISSKKNQIEHHTYRSSVCVPVEKRFIASLSVLCYLPLRTLVSWEIILLALRWWMAMINIHT